MTPFRPGAPIINIYLSCHRFPHAAVKLSLPSRRQWHKSRATSVLMGISFDILGNYEELSTL